MTVPSAPQSLKEEGTPTIDLDAELRRDVQTLREATAALLAEEAELVWKSWALGESVDFAELSKRRESLVTMEARSKVHALIGKVGAQHAAPSLRAFAIYLEGELLARATEETSDEVAQLAAAAIVSVDGQEIPYRELEAALAAEAHAGNRRKLAQAADATTQKIGAVRERRERELATAVTALGYSSVLDYELALRRVDDVAALSALAEQVLARTEASYRASLEERSKRELGRRSSLEDVRRADLPRLVRTGEVDTYFPKEKLLETIDISLARMGLGPGALPQLVIDGNPHPRRNPRALALVLGRQVRVSLRPASGLTAAAQAFHEVGHAVQAAAVTNETWAKNPGDTALGTGAVGEAAGFLFEDLLGEPRFAESIGVPPEKTSMHARASALRRLVTVRRLAGRVLVELAWRGGRREEASAIMGRALGFPMEIGETGDYLASADSLRGMLASAQLRAELASELGPRWWEEARAGERIAAWFSAGTMLTIEELVQQAGAKAIDVEPFAIEIETLLGGLPSLPSPKAGP